MRWMAGGRGKSGAGSCGMSGGPLRRDFGINSCGTGRLAMSFPFLRRENQVIIRTRSLRARGQTKARAISRCAVAGFGSFVGSPRERRRRRVGRFLVEHVLDEMKDSRLGAQGRQS